MRRSALTSSAGLGLALCLVLSSAAFGDTEPPSPTATVEVTQTPTDSQDQTPPSAPTSSAPATTSSAAPSSGTADADAPGTDTPEPGTSDVADEDDAETDAPANNTSEADASDPSDIGDEDDAEATDEAAAQAHATAAVITPFSAGQSVETVADGLTAEEIVASLVGSGITVSNVVYTGHGSAFGIASGMGAIGIANGIVLSSGSVQVTDDDKGGLVGPNESDGYGNGFDNPGDPDLSELAEQNTYDAAVLEFDFVPTSSQLVFHYVFASEEYNEYVGDYNDVFAFYVNGVNCAMIGDAPVSVNNINNDVNSHLYVDNDPSDLGEPTPHDTEMDGFTTVLTCSVNVNAGQTNHIKLAIADAGDSVLDSLVIIQQGSFSSQPPPVAANDAYSTVVGESLVVVVPGLTGNDTQSPGGGALAAVKVTDPANGTVVLNEDGSFTYTPNAGFTGTDSFTYLVTDVWGNSNIATVTIDVASGQVIPDVTPIETPPAKQPISVTTPVSPVSSKALAATGTDVAGLGAISVTLLAGGIAMLTVGRRRKNG